jgi:hypothetical protein
VSKRAFGVVESVDDVSQLLERAAEARSLSGRGLEQRHDFVIRDRGVHLVERARNPFDAGVRSRAHVRTGMKHDPADAEALGAVELIDHGRDRFLVELLVRRREVDQIRSVREDRRHRALFREQRAIVVGQLLPFPLIGVLGEDRDRLRVDLGRAVERGVQTSARRDVRADEVAMLS